VTNAQLANRAKGLVFEDAVLVSFLLLSVVKEKRKLTFRVSMLASLLE
jgi:hypothetical protein